MDLPAQDSAHPTFSLLQLQSECNGYTENTASHNQYDHRGKNDSPASEECEMYQPNIQTAFGSGEPAVSVKTEKDSSIQRLSSHVDSTGEIRGKSEFMAAEVNNNEIGLNSTDLSRKQELMLGSVDLMRTGNVDVARNGCATENVSGAKRNAHPYRRGRMVSQLKNSEPKIVSIVK